MNEQQIKKLHKQHWQPGYGSISWEEAIFIQEVVETHRPAKVIEIGTATGLSSGFICRFMDEFGGQCFTTIDLSSKFYADPTKVTGFLLPAIYTGSNIQVQRITGNMAIDVEGLDDPHANVAFIDANHQHPWPTLDTLFLYPFMIPPAIVLHHDLDLYRHQEPIVWGIGPKFLYDQTPSQRRLARATTEPNIYGIDLTMPKADFEVMCAQALHLPWSVRQPLSFRLLIRIRNFLIQHYSPSLVRAFEKSVDLYNRANPYLTR